MRYVHVHNVWDTIVPSIFSKKVHFNNLKDMIYSRFNDIPINYKIVKTPTQMYQLVQIGIPLFTKTEIKILQ